jgi:hypothetical protein
MMITGRVGVKDSVTDGVTVGEAVCVIVGVWVDVRLGSGVFVNTTAWVAVELTLKGTQLRKKPVKRNTIPAASKINPVTKNGVNRFIS